jgi:hypothetical protein
MSLATIKRLLGGQEVERPVEQAFASTSPPGAAGEGHSLDPVLRRRKGALRTDRRGACRSGRNLAGFGRAAANELKGDGGLIRPSAYPQDRGKTVYLSYIHDGGAWLIVRARASERVAGLGSHVPDASL